MKVVKVNIYKHDMQLKAPWAIAGRVMESVENIFIELITEEGLIGLGSGAPSPDVAGESVEDSHVKIKHFSKNLIGVHLDDANHVFDLLENNLKNFPAARSAIDMAIYDLLSKSEDKSLIDLLGRSIRTLPTSITIGVSSFEKTVADAKAHIDNGFSHLKIKIGENVDEDIEKVSALFDISPESVSIRVDANRGYSLKDLEKFYDKSIEEIKEEFFTQIEDRMKSQQMQEEITAEVSVSPKDVRSFFNSFPTDSIPLINSKISVAQITIEPKVTAEEKLLIKNKLTEIRDQIINQELTFAIAAEYKSEDPGSKKKQGDFGWVTRGDFVPEFDAVAFRIPIGEVSQVFESPFGYHILIINESFTYKSVNGFSLFVVFNFSKIDYFLNCALIVTILNFFDGIINVLIFNCIHPVNWVFFVCPASVKKGKVYRFISGPTFSCDIV